MRLSFQWPWQRRPRPAEWEEWYDAQVRAYKAGLEIEPPWVAFPESEPWSFKQGVNEAWLMEVFLPFWKGRTTEERVAYLEKWPPPSDFWREDLIEKWI